MPTPLPTPVYSPSDYGAAAAFIIAFVLDVLTGYGVLPAVDPATRVPLMASLTLLSGLAIGAYIRNRNVKHNAQAAVAVAHAAASPIAPPPPAPVLPTSGTFQLIPVVPGPSESISAPRT